VPSPPGADGASGSASGSAGDPRAARTVAIWRAALDTLALRVAQLDTAAASLGAQGGVDRAREAFVAARRAFKHVELGLEYYTPSTARGMNGPALPEVEETEGPEAVYPPTGFQVIEEVLYADDPRAEQELLTQETGTLRQLATRARTMFAAQQSTDDRVWDAAKLEIARIVSLGITGFDSPVAGRSLAEADAALEGVARALAPYRTSAPAWAGSTPRWARRARRCRPRRIGSGSTTSRSSSTAANPLARALRDARWRSASARRASGGIPRGRAHALRLGRVRRHGLRAARREAPTAAQVELGRRLFHDTRLSGDGRRACSSCHVPEQAFADGMRVNRARGGAPLARNTPTGHQQRPAARRLLRPAHHLPRGPGHRRRRERRRDARQPGRHRPRAGPRPGAGGALPHGLR
jgi:cytochrome c peroxidase